MMTNLEHRHDVGVVQISNDPGLMERVRPRPGIGADYLDGDLAVELRVVGSVDFALGTTAEPFKNLETADLARHGVRSPESRDRGREDVGI